MLVAIIHLYCDVPEPRKFSEKDLNDELRIDKSMKVDIKQKHKSYQTWIYSSM
jgi:hypothetical protein